MPHVQSGGGGESGWCSPAALLLYNIIAVVIDQRAAQAVIAAVKAVLHAVRTRIITGVVS